MEKLTILAYPSADAATKSILERDGFIDALDDRQLQIDIRRQNPTSRDTALTLAMKLDVLNRGAMRDNESSSTRPRYLRAVSASEDGQASGEPATPTKPSTELSRRTGSGSQRPGRGGADSKENTRDWPQKGKQQPPKLEQMMHGVMERLDNLQLEVNTVKEQQQFRRQSTVSNASRPATSTEGAATASWQQTGQAPRRSAVVCYNCGEVGHIRRDCRAPVGYAGGGNGAGQSAHSGAESRYHTSGRRMHSL